MRPTNVSHKETGKGANTAHALLVQRGLSEPATDNAALRFMQCDALELWGYRKYIAKMSPFATRQGIKGAEFDKVIVVVDDQEGRTNTSPTVNISA